jgi:nucleoside-diphosphate-sugar epimerase
MTPESGRVPGDRPAVFLTGGTGFLGSHLAAAFLKAGRNVRLLARDGPRRSADERVRALLDWHAVPSEARTSLAVVKGDILLPGLGVASTVRDELRKEGCEVVHCASHTSFAESRRAEVETVNLGGLASVLDFAADVRASFFHHVSTAYVAGRTAGACLEEPANPTGYHNVYEETKCRGEAMARNACRRAGIGLAIYRPSIVYGDSKTGRSLAFNAVYYPVRTALFLRKTFERDLLERRGERAEPLGVRFEDGDILRLPLRIDVGGGPGIDLVPVDHFASAFMALSAEARDGDVFHIVNGRPKPIADIIVYSQKLFRMTGIRACRPGDFDGVPRNALERLYEHYLEAYGPYMKDLRTFGIGRSGPILERAGLRCPEFDEAVFARCMNYAVATGWDPALPG